MTLDYRLSGLKRWLGLGLPVLLLHLGLLQSMPLGFNPGHSPTDPALHFVMRTITPAPTPVTVAPGHTAAPRQKSRSAAVTPAPMSAPTDEPAAASTPAATVSLAGAETRPSTEAADLPATATHPVSSQSPPAPASAESSAEPEPDPAPASASALAESPNPVSRPPRSQAPNVHVARLTASVRLAYKVQSNKFPFSLNGELLWHNLGNRYTARLSYSAFGLSRSQSSRGQITEAGLAPERFADKYRGEVAAHFNYPQGIISFSSNTPDAPLLTGAQDRLSVLLQLGALLANAPERFQTGTTLTLQTAGARDADLWLFTFEDIETLALPGGSVHGHKLVRLPRKPYDQKIEVWLAPELGYLPGRIRIQDANGDTIDQQWQASSAVEADTDPQ